MAGARLTQRVIRHDRHRNALRELLIRQAQQLTRCHGSAQPGEVGGVKAGYVDGISNTQVHLIGQDDAGQEVAAADADVLSDSQDR